MLGTCVMVFYLQFKFRDIVLASHLKPLDKKDISGAPRKQPWNTIAAGSKHENTSPEVIQVRYSLYKENCHLH